ncbi:hypothetical protein AB9C52_28145, partial [Burkholderia cenocepacia]|uniref:hypothetical protein n=1 Tax=Burkholderia cenocepacia TaxID=95486 RepID=UPI0035106A6A
PSNRPGVRGGTAPRTDRKPAARHLSSGAGFFSPAGGARLDSAPAARICKSHGQALSFKSR